MKYIFFNHQRVYFPRLFALASAFVGLLLMRPAQSLAAAAGTPGSECELWMSFEYHNGNQCRTPRVDSVPVCIKRSDKPIEIPQTHQVLLSNNWEITRFKRYFCRGHMDLVIGADNLDGYDDVMMDNERILPKETKEGNRVEKLTSAVQSLGKGKDRYTGGKVYICKWNQRFHNYYPFTIRIYSTRGESSRNPLSDYIQAIRAFRNGELVYSWVSASGNETELMIPGEGLTANRLPHLAEFDLRVIPRGLIVKPEILRQRVSAKHRDWKSEAERITGAAWHSLPPATQTALKDYQDCFGGYTSAIYRIASAISGDSESQNQTMSPSIKDACTRLANKRAQYSGVTELEKLLNRMENRTGPDGLPALERQIGKAILRTPDAVRDEFDRMLAQLSLGAQRQVAPELQSLLRDLGAQPEAIAAGLQATAAINEMRAKFDDALAALRSTRGLIDVVVQDALAPLSDPANQARLFAKFADGLGNESTFFEPRAHNPPTLNGEQALLMDYVDPHQFYIFAPWHVLALRVGQFPGTTLGAENLIPAIDVVGYRHQWARSRFADLRLGLGGLFVKDNLPVSDPANPTQTIGKDYFNFAAQLSLALGGFKLGVAYILTDGVQDPVFLNSERVRILLGVDLVKLLSGRNVEIF